MPMVQLPVEKGYDTHMVMHSGTSNYDVSLDKEYQKYLSHALFKHGLIDQGKRKK